jgi:2,3-diketo-5-methylthiopentyl-1-phosphate enolase
VDRPLILGILKPPVGLKPSEAADIFYDMALGGADIIKDDEKIANASYSSVIDRVKGCIKAEKKAYEETGERTYYAVNITDTPKNIYDNAKAAIEAGGNMLMMSPMTCGFGTLQDLAQDPNITVPIMVHPDFLGGYSRSPYLGMSTTLTIGKLPRLLGADLSDFATPYGSVPMLKEKYLKLAIILVSSFYHLRKTWPMVGGALHPGAVPAVLKDLGQDAILGAGGAVLAHPLGSTSGVSAFRQVLKIHSEKGDISSEYAHYPELKAAIEKWGLIES